MKNDSFTYKEGFFELPYLVNSPQEMIEGFKRMPLIRSNEENQSIAAKNPILNVIVYYREIESGLFLIYSEVKFKSNVCFRHMFDKSKPLEYYCLSLRIDHYSKVNNSLANGISYTDNSWLIFKPGAKVNHHHFKGTKGRYFSVYFTKEWIKKYMSQVPLKEKRMLNLFMKSDNDHLICPNLPGQSIFNTNNLCKHLLSGNAKEKAHLNELKSEVQNFIRFFTSKMESENINERHFQVSNLERIKVLKAGKILEEHIEKKFPGIEHIAKEVGLSGTKLKESFKSVYDETLFNHFRNMQMTKAHELITGTKQQIGQIARRFGYENASKFTAAFKACYNKLPSEVGRGK